MRAAALNIRLEFKKCNCIFFFWRKKINLHAATSLSFYFSRRNLNHTVLDTKQRMLMVTNNSDRKTVTQAEPRRVLTDTPMLMASIEPLNTLLTNMDSVHG